MPLQLNLKYSIVGSTLYIVVSTFSLFIVLLTALPWQLKWLLSFIIIACAIYTVFSHSLRLLPWSIVALKINNKNQLQLITHAGKAFEVTVLNNTTVSTYLTVLNCRQIEATYWQHIFPPTIIIFSNDVDEEAYRKLRVWLRWTKIN